MLSPQDVSLAEAYIVECEDQARQASFGSLRCAPSAIVQPVADSTPNSPGRAYSGNFSFVRISAYRTERTFYLGELTIRALNRLPPLLPTEPLIEGRMISTQLTAGKTGA
jgi:hypothetical protein